MGDMVKLNELLQKRRDDEQAKDAGMKVQRLNQNGTQPVVPLYSRDTRT